MNNPLTQPITLLREMIETRYGQAITGPATFDGLSSAIFDATRQNVSVSTLKRLWGYVSAKSSPRASTLDVLCRYIGFRDWPAFCQYAQSGMVPESDFHDSEIVKSADLDPGDEVLLEWLPDRRCRLRCVGPMRFEVVETVNTKLSAGDTLTVAVFAKGQPLEAINVVHDGRMIESYVAGRSNGLTRVELKSGVRSCGQV